MPYYLEFGRLITTYLHDQERSASWLATRLGVHPSTVANWQNGANRPKSPELVIRIADILGIHTPAARQALLTAAGYAYVATADNQTPVPSPAAPSDEQVTPVEQAAATGDAPTSDTPVVETEPVTHSPTTPIEAMPTLYGFLRPLQVRTRLKKLTAQLAARLNEPTTKPVPALPPAPVYAPEHAPAG